MSYFFYDIQSLHCKCENLCSQALFSTVKKPDYTLMGEDAYAQFKIEPLLNRLDLRGYRLFAMVHFICYV
jgi:hypothetical protein